MSKSTLLVCALLVTAFAVALIVCGCGGTSGTSLYFNVDDRASWSSGERLAFASFGGQGLLYIYTITDSGGSSLLLTPSDNDDDLADEGGWHPAYSPDDSQIAFSSRRNTTPVIFLMDSTDGDRAGATQVTTDSDSGADTQVSWKPDGTGLIYTSTRRNANPDIRTIDTDGNNMVELLDSDFDEQWASYKPTDDNIIVLESDWDADNSEDTDIFICDISSLPPTYPADFTKIANSAYSDGAPSWNLAGTKIAFHSDRAGDFDIWVYDILSATLTQLTSDTRSDGYPIWNSDGTRIAFTRDRELWSVLAADGTDPQRITRRFP